MCMNSWIVIYGPTIAFNKLYAALQLVYLQAHSYKIANESRKIPSKNFNLFNVWHHFSIYNSILCKM